MSARAAMAPGRRSAAPGRAAAAIAAALCAVFVCGCESPRPQFDRRNPPVEILEGGRVVYRGLTVPLQELPDRLRSDGVGRRDEIPVLLGYGVTQNDLKPLSGYMMSKGYTRLVYVTPERGVSFVKGQSVEPAQHIARPGQDGQTPRAPTVRYRRSR